MRRALRHIGRWLLLILGALGLVVLFLLTPGGLNWTAKRVVSGLSIFQNASLQLERVEGNVFRELRLIDVRLVGADDSAMVVVPHAEVGFRLLPLLAGNVHLTEVDIEQPVFTMAEDEQGAWDLLQVIETDTTASTWRVHIEDVRISQGTVKASSFSSRGDSTYTIENIDINLDRFETGEAIQLALDTLRASMWVPGRTEPVEIDLGGQWAGNSIRLDRLRISSSRSKVTGAGTISVPGEGNLAGSTDFSVAADPLHVNDIRLFAPWLAPGHEVNLLVDVEGSTDSLTGVVHADGDEGSEIDAQGVYRIGESGERVYELHVRIPSLSSRLFEPAFLPTGTYSAELDLELAGPDARQMSGMVEGFLINTPDEIENKRDSSRFEIAFENGTGRTSLFALIDDVSYQLAGRIAPFEDLPEYDVSSTITGFDAEHYTNGSQSSDLNATLHLRGKGYDPETMSGSVELYFDPSMYNRWPISAGTLAVQIDDSELIFNGFIESEKGYFRAEGNTGLARFNDIHRLTADFSNFDIAAVLGDTINSALTGSLEAIDVLFEADRSRGSVALEFPEATYGNYVLRDSRIEGMLEEGHVDLLARGLLNDGLFDVEGFIAPFETVTAYEVTRGEISGMDVGAFMDSSGVQSALNGRFTLAGSGFEPGVLHARGNLELTASQFNDQAIQSAEADFSMLGDTLAIDIQLDLPEGNSAIRGSVTRLTTDPHFRIAGGVFENLDVGRLAGISDLSTRLNGAITGQGRGRDLAVMEASASLELSASVVNGARIEDGTTSVSIDRNSASIESYMSIDDGVFNLQMEAENLSQRPRYRFSGNIQQVDVARLVTGDTLSSQVNFSIEGEGEGAEPETMILKGVAEGGVSTYRGLRVDELRLEFSMEEGLLLVDTLQINSSAAQITGHGPIALYDDRGASPSDFEFETQLLNIEPLAPLLGLDNLSLQDGTLTTRVYGRPGTLRMDTRAALAGLVYNTVHAGDVTVRFTGEFDSSRALEMAELRGDVQAMSIPGFVLEDVRTGAAYQNGEVLFEVDGRLDAQRDVRVAGRFFAAADTQHVQFDVIDLKLDEDQWSLDQPAIIEVGQEYRVSRFLLMSNEQQIAIDGVVNFNGDQNLLVTIENFDTGTVADLLGFTGLDGPFNGLFDIQGPADAPIVMGEADMRVIAFEEEAGELQASLLYEDHRLNLDASMRQVDGSTMALSGFLPMDLSLVDPEESGTGFEQRVAEEGEVDLQLAADSAQISWILPFIDQAFINRIEALVTAEVRLSGTASDPQLEGQGRLEQGRLRSPFLGITYQDISSNISLRDNVVQLSDTYVGSNEGSLRGSGTIEFETLTSLDLNIDIQADQFKAIDTREYKATASASLKLAGSYLEPVLSGDVRLLSADMYLDEMTEGGMAELNVQLTDEDLLMLEREFGIRAGEADTTTFDLYEALSMDIDVLIERDAWVRSRKNPEMNVQFSGQVDLTKMPRQDHVVFGSIEVNPDRSYINQFGKRFDITLGTLTFNGPASDPLIDFEARYEVPSRRSQENAVTINLDMEGRIAELDLTLSSEPTMELTDIISFVVTGRPASEALQLGGAGQGTGIAITQGVGLLTGAIETMFQESGLDLDVIQIEPLENARGATITAGKYVTPRLFTAVSQPIGASDSAGSGRREGTVVTLELELIDSLLLRLLGGESVMQINLLWHHAY